MPSRSPRALLRDLRVAEVTSLDVTIDDGSAPRASGGTLKRPRSRPKSVGSGGRPGMAGCSLVAGLEYAVGAMRRSRCSRDELLGALSHARFRLVEVVEAAGFRTYTMWPSIT